MHNSSLFRTLLFRKKIS